MINIHQVFSPGQAITSIDEFAGRQQQLERAASALSMRGVSIILFGYRGVGKTSLARQVLQIAQGDKETMARLPAYLQTPLSYEAIFFSAAYGVGDTNSLISQVLTDDSGLRQYISDSAAERARSVSGGLSFGPMRLSANSSETRAVDAVPQEVLQVFKNAIRNCKSETGSDVVIFVDEFDKIGSQAGFAEFMKACEDLPVRFVLVGVSKDLAGLLADHASIARQIRNGQIYVPPMTESERSQIFEQIHDKLSGEYVFAPAAVEYISKLSLGHPYIIHVLGHQSLIVAAEKGVSDITDRVVKVAFQRLTTDDNFDLEITYRRAVRGSAQREFVLKAFALEDSEIIKTKAVYNWIEQKSDIPRNSIPTYAGHLCSEEYGAPLQSEGYGAYRFQDNVFKAYCRERQFDFWTPK